MTGRLRAVALFIGLIVLTVVFGFLSAWVFISVPGLEAGALVGAVVGGVILAVAAAHLALASLFLGWSMLAFR